MSHPISLTDLREVCRFDPLPDEENLRVRGSDLLALVDAVEAAHGVREPNVDYTHEEIQALRRLDAALARFTFDAEDGR